ncbi:MAG: stage II sporulation protein P [Oscillospiraceae bacterium]|nr:stage II sporulation protein P [Oscillospiraceae bacterium]
MYPILYRRKTRTCFCAGLLAFALLLRILSEPKLRETVWEKTKAVLGSERLFRTVIFLETGVLPEARRAELPPQTEPPAGTEAPPQSETAGAVGQAAESTARPTEAEPAAAQPVPAFTAAEAESIGLRGNCSYAVDKAALLLQPLNWPDAPGPKVLILHSHSCEAYTPSPGHEYEASAEYRTLDPANSVIAVGDALAEALTALGVEVLHDRTYNDYPSYNASYAVAREKIQDYLTRFPSLVMVLDLHRDATDPPVREIAEYGGEALAPLMIAVGTDEGGLEHPHWADNLSCGLKLQALGLRETPELFRKLSFRRERFNTDLSPGSLIVEVGSTGNTLPEALASMKYLARYLAELLRCP